MQKVIRSNDALGTRDEFRRVMNLRGIDVVSTRLWLDKRVATQYPANVLAGFDDDMGSTYFNLNALHVRAILCRLPCVYALLVAVPVLTSFAQVSLHCHHLLRVPLRVPCADDSCLKVSTLYR